MDEHISVDLCIILCGYVVNNKEVADFTFVVDFIFLTLATIWSGPIARYIISASQKIYQQKEKKQ